MTDIEGLVIAERDCGEASKWITLLTRELACIDVFVRQGKKSRRAMSSAQLFCLSRFSLNERRDAGGGMHYYFSGAEPVKMFYKLRLDAKRVALACYLAELLSFGTVSSDNGGEVMRLTLNCFYFLDNGERDAELIKSIFELRLLCETGYRPALLGCSECCAVEHERMYLDLKTGLMRCGDCAQITEGEDIFALDKTLTHIIRYIALVDFERLFSFRISERYQKKLTIFTEAFCRYHYGKSFSTLKFYRSI